MLIISTYFSFLWHPEGSKLMVTPKDKKTNPLGSCKPSSLLNTDVLVSSLCEDKGSENSDTKNLSSPSLVCPSSLILKTPTYSMYTPSKSSLKMWAAYFLTSTVLLYLVSGKLMCSVLYIKSFHFSGEPVQDHIWPLKLALNVMWL